MASLDAVIADNLLPEPSYKAFLCASCDHFDLVDVLPSCALCRLSTCASCLGEEGWCSKCRDAFETCTDCKKVTKASSIRACQSDLCQEALCYDCWDAQEHWCEDCLYDLINCNYDSPDTVKEPPLKKQKLAVH